MNKKQKLHQSMLPGNPIGAKVVEKDIKFALRIWKKQLKEAGTLAKLKSKKEFIKPSEQRRKQLNRAIYLESNKQTDKDY